MSDLKQAAQQALEALHSVEWHGGSSAWMLNDCKVEGAIHALRAALAEPVPDSKHSTIAEWRADKQRKPLTEAEIDGLMQSIGLRCADDGNERMANHAEWERRQRRRIVRAIERAIWDNAMNRDVCQHFNPVDLPCDECKVENAAAKERQFIINFLESMHERCLGRHNYYLHAAKLISNLPPAKST